MHAPTADSAEPILFERHGRHVALITLNRPGALNAINAAMATRLETLVQQVESDPELRVAILTGAGSKAFCAGADLKEVSAGRSAALMTTGAGFAGFVHAPKQKPWIAAVHGFVLGGGLEISLACDMIVAADNAQLGLPEPKRGLVAGAGGMYRLARAIPRAIALEMLSSGAPINAQRAYELGLVNRVIDAARLLDTALALAEQIAANSPLSVRESLAIGRIAGEQQETALRALTSASVKRVMAGEDAREGPRAFVEKRSPQWQS